MKVNKKGESDGGSLSTVAKFIVLGIAVFVVIFYFIPLGEKTETAIGGATDFQCEISPELCEESNNLNSLSEKEIDDIDDVIEKNNLNSELVYAIIDIESSGNLNALRFECSIFNNPQSKYCTSFPETRQVSCDDGSDVNTEAFERALEINRERTICSTSIGLFQVVGFNYENIGLTIEQYYDRSQSLEGQLEIFDAYLDSRPDVRRELQSNSPDVEEVARLYNGPNYKENNYDDKLNQRLS
ncbi:MAG: N-acetylmuramidase domain-containing protein [Nanoarchaeota archaeon]|nr:N-acetylmuramidase domain-containing protein [Nanoarchaeota archaeon]